MPSRKLTRRSFGYPHPTAPQQLHATFSVQSAKMRLDHTAALVTSWAAPLYAEGPTAAFVGQLDLSQGQELLARCDGICPWYGEVIRDRKHFLSHFIQKELATRAEQCQVVIPAAGVSPLAFELLLSQRDRVKKVIEVDIAGTAEKHRLYSTVAPHLADRIACVTADITTAGFSAGMLETEGGYQPDVPTIVLFEGISYYITEAQLRRAIAVFRSAQQQNLIVLEHLVPCALVNEARRSIPSGIFRTIGTYVGLSNIRCYSPAHVEALFQSVRCSEVQHYSSTDMERVRKGKPQRFVEDGDGWIGCAVGAI
ncbi:MAG: class I SAM-dependent methyltransferase [Halobacteriota archaeon]